MKDYRAGQREFAEWLTNQGLKLRRVEDKGLQRDADGWEHFAWTMHVVGQDGEVYTFPYRQGMAHTKRPKLADVMSSLLRDAEGERSSFEDWAREYGYDVDSRKALATFDEVAVNNGRLVRMFGRDLDAILAQASPLLDAAGL